MFGFMKKHSEKDKEERERKKREKKEKKEQKTSFRASKGDKTRPPSTTHEELARLEEAKKGLFRKTNDRQSFQESGHAVAYRDPEHHRDEAYPSDSSESITSMNSQTQSREQSMENIASHAVAGNTHSSQKRSELTKPHKPPVLPKPDKRGILKEKSSYGPEIPNHGVRGNVDAPDILEENTQLNEELSGVIGAEAGDGDSKKPKSGPNAKAGSPARPNQLKKSPQRNSSPRSTPPKFTTPPPPSTAPPPPPILVEPTPPSPSEKTFGDVDLQLPSVAPPRCPRPREILLKRQPAGDFGFTLRRGTVLERSVEDNQERKRMVIFAEPGPKNTSTGLLPGDRLVEVNGHNVESASREDIIELIKASRDSVALKVQPIPELAELSMRSGLDGEDVHIEEQSMKTGTLQRSGSMRFKSRMAKSDEQVEVERAWLMAEKVWLVHKGGFTAARVLKASDGLIDSLAENRCKVKLDYNQQELEVDDEDVEKANPPQFDRIEDLATLRYLNESSVLHTLRQRYGSNLIHTYGGQSLCVINPMHPLSIYSEKVIQMFRGCKPEDMPPHIYATAQIAYRTMLATRYDQSIVLTGRSGSGKTTNARHILLYLTMAAGSVNNILTVEKMNAVFTLLDTFGNSRTIMNTSATKYTQLTSLDFDHAGQIAAASIQVLMLERTRIVKRPEGEPTYHVFYQMLAGIETQLRTELHLQNLNEPNMFMTPLQRVEDRQRATAAWAKVNHAMSLLGIQESEVKVFCAILAAIYHLGVAAVAKGPNNKFQFGRPAAAQKAAAVLGTTVEELSRTIFSPNIQITPPRASFRGQTPEKPSPSEGVHGLEALEGFVIGLYSELFSALVSLINRSLSSNYRTVSSLLILDQPGFQNPASCGRTQGATFDDLCHNYAQERLQLLFHDSVFTAQQDLYAQEGVECDFEMVTSSPQPMVSLIDRPPQQNVTTENGQVRSIAPDSEVDQRGLLWLLDEEAIYPGANEQTFLERLFQNHADKRERRSSLLRKGGPHHFLLNHFQGTNPVSYNVKGWLRASRENPISRTVNGFLQDSNKEDMASLFSNVRGPMASIVSGSVVGIEGSSSLRRASSMRRAYTTGAAGLKRKSICLQVKFQVDSVIETIRRTKMHFVHCLLPQHNAGLCDLRAALTPNKPTDDIMMNVPLVRAQVRGAEVLEAIRIHRQGFPEHMQFAEFRRRFDLLSGVEVRPQSPLVDEKTAVEALLKHLEVDKATYRLGLSQVFFRAGGLAQLEDARDEKITGTIVNLQALCRGYMARQNLKKRKLQHLAISCIQRNVRKFMAIKEWPWWRLYTKVQPVLNVHKTEEDLRLKEIELETLQSKFEKLEKERNDYKHNCERYETKLSEMTVDFQEEHTTSAHATELLEAETTARIRAERELKEIQNKFNTLQRRNEATEMELMHTRLLAASIDEYEDDEGVDGDSVYRERYERTRRELELLKKRKQQQHEEEIEAKEAAKKVLERKLIESTEELEEHRRQVSNLKRKSQRLNTDMQDMRLHIEDQTSRNSDLEKKQRKFDSELAKFNTQLREEKTQREKLQRERDALVAEKFQLEQENKTLVMDIDLLNEKTRRLEQELQDMASAGTKDDKEMASIKRIRTEFESKVQEQEEELDEQAGTIQQLEQAKLRLEMAQEKVRQQHLRELEEKETELEEMRAATQKKLRNFENQLEEEYSEKQSILKEKREIERKLTDLQEQAPLANRETEKRLRRDLKRTRALLADAQMMLDKHKEGGGNRATIKQLRNQLEDAEYATAAAVKARKGLEVEVADLQQQIDDLNRQKAQVEDRLLATQREKNDISSKLEENEEDMAEVMKKYKAVVQQQSVDSQTILDQSEQIELLTVEKEGLQEQLGSLQTSLDFLQGTTVDKQSVARLESKVRDLESRLDLEHAAKHRAEVALSRAKEQLEHVGEEKDSLNTTGMSHMEEIKRLQRQLRELKDQVEEAERREADVNAKRQDLEKKIDTLEVEYDQSQADLKLAFKRIADLQAIIEDEMDSDIESDELTDEDEDLSASDDSEDYEDYIVSNHIAAHRLSSADALQGNGYENDLGASLDDR